MSRRTDRSIVLKDATLREGLDTPGVSFDPQARARIVRALAAAGVAEAEVVAPSRVEADLEAARGLPRRRIRLSALVYAAASDADDEVRRAAGTVDRVDLLMPLSRRRRPFAAGAKRRRLVSVLDRAPHDRIEIGAGFPHAFTADERELLTIAAAAAEAGARRITVYDTNGAAEPFAVRDRIARLVGALGVPVFFHGHDDLGLATANAWAAVSAGAAGLDVTVNGLGDRAGNASLEQVAALLRVRGVETGIALDRLLPLARLVARASRVPIPALAPIVGAHVFAHRSPAHVAVPAEFEAFDPGLIGASRRLVPAPDRRR